MLNSLAQVTVPNFSQGINAVLTNDKYKNNTKNNKEILTTTTTGINEILTTTTTTTGINEILTTTTTTNTQTKTTQKSK